MLEFLKTHPSLLIIGATIIIIILIFLFFMKKSTQEYKIEQMDLEYRSNEHEYIELQEIPDEVDNTVPTTPPLPAPKLSRKLRYDSSNQPKKPLHVYDTPRVHEFETIPESITDESCSSFSYVSAELHQQVAVDVAGISGNSGNPVVYRHPQSKNKENRVSVSEVHKHGSYVSFDWDFETIDEFKQSCADTMRITVDFDANNSNYIVPVANQKQY